MVKIWVTCFSQITLEWYQVVPVQQNTATHPGIVYLNPPPTLAKKGDMRADEQGQLRRDVVAKES